jgi:hypothetical protein
VSVQQQSERQAVAFDDGDHRVYVSDDGGRHWHELP